MAIRTGTRIATGIALAAMLTVGVGTAAFADEPDPADPPTASYQPTMTGVYRWYGPTSVYPDTHTPQVWSDDPGTWREGCAAPGDPGVTSMSDAADAFPDLAASDSLSFSQVFVWELTHADGDDSTFTLNVMDGACSSEWHLTGDVILMSDDAGPSSTAPVTISGSTLSFSPAALYAWTGMEDWAAFSFWLPTTDGLMLSGQVFLHGRAIAANPTPDPTPSTEPSPDSTSDPTPTADPAPHPADPVPPSSAQTGDGSSAPLLWLTVLLGVAAIMSFIVAGRRKRA